MRHHTLIEANWSEANFKERWFLTTFDTTLQYFTNHDESMTILLTLLGNIIEEDEIDTVIEQFNKMRKH
jgi:hypothetical protein